MKLAPFLGLSVLAFGGCAWRNPYDTSVLAAEQRWRRDYAVYLERRSFDPLPAPQRPTPEYSQPSLDDWRSSVLEVADPVVLARMESDSQERLSRLRARVRDLEEGPERVYDGALAAARRDVAVEERKLILIQLRQESKR